MGMKPAKKGKKEKKAELIKAAPGGDGEGMPCMDECKDADKATCEGFMEDGSCEDCGDDCPEMCGACMDCAECFMDAMADKGMPCADACRDADKETCFGLMEDDACEDCGEDCHEMCGACGDCGACFESMMDDGDDDKPAMKKMKPKGKKG